MTVGRGHANQIHGADTKERYSEDGSIEAEGGGGLSWTTFRPEAGSGSVASKSKQLCAMGAEGVIREGNAGRSIGNQSRRGESANGHGHS